MQPTITALKEKYRRVADALLHEYGYPRWRQHLPPVDELVNTILSQNTSDANRDLAFERLRARFPTWEAVRDAAPHEIIEAIRPAGLANQKGPRMGGGGGGGGREVGSISLDHLQDMPVGEAKARLMSINGIGPKTAAIILLFSFNKPAFPVDTHVHRVSRRLGLVDPKTSAEQAHVEMEQIVPAEDYYAFHLQLIQHGRQVCQARTPQCALCVLQDCCDYYASLKPDNGESARP